MPTVSRPRTTKIISAVELGVMRARLRAGPLAKAARESSGSACPLDWLMTTQGGSVWTWTCSRSGGAGLPDRHPCHPEDPRPPPYPGGPTRTRTSAVSVRRAIPLPRTGTPPTTRARRRPVADRMRPAVGSRSRGPPQLRYCRPAAPRRVGVGNSRNTAPVGSGTDLRDSHTYCRRRASEVGFRSH